MTVSVTEIKVFISCPGDVGKEKDIVISVCDSISRLLQNKRIILKPIHWKKDIIPQITGEVPQKIIDRKLEESDYDIYCGILWRRFGDPIEGGFTPTESEFENALLQYQKRGRPLITFFFKNKELPPNDQYEMNQIEAVKKFSSRLKDIGLYKTFINDLDFQRISYETIYEFTMKLAEAEAEAVSCIRIKYDKVEKYLFRKIIPFESYKSDLMHLSLYKEKQDILDLIKRENRIVLIGEAGVGKTVELKRIVAEFSDVRSVYFPILINLNKYVDQKIDEFLPENWQTIPEFKLLLVLDGLDEIESKNKHAAIRRIELFSEIHPAATIVISCRANFYRSGFNYSSGTLSGFKTFMLLPIDYEQIESYLDRNLVTRKEDFLERIMELKLLDLLYNPFYLIEIVNLYNKDRKLPDNRSDLYEGFIKIRFKSDELHYRTSFDLLGFRQILFKMLSKIAICAETLGRNYITDDELQKLLPENRERELLKYSSLIAKRDTDTTTWQFDHNSIQEYLSARVLSQQPLEVAKSFISFGPDHKKIIPSWLNTVSFLCSNYPGEEFVVWVLAVEPEVTIKFEPDKVSEPFRNEIFKKIIKYYNEKQIWIDRDRFSHGELARFGHTPENIHFLISEIERSTHYTAAGNAINILGYMHVDPNYKNRLCDLLISIALNEFHIEIPTHVQQDALNALSDLKYDSKAVIDTIVCKLKSSDSDWVRYGLYYLIHNSDFINDHIDLFLSGINFVRFDLHDTSGRRSRLANERSELIEGVKKASTFRSLKKILEYFIVNDRDIRDLFFRNHDIRFLAFNAVNVYKDRPEIFELALDFCLMLYKNHYQDEAKQFILFFEKTRMRNLAFRNVLFQKVRFKEEFLADIATDDCSEYLLEEYSKGNIEDENVWRILHTFRWRNKQQFSIIYNSLTKNYATRFHIKQPIDWQKLRNEARQNDFKLLFDQAKFIGEILKIYKEENKILLSKDDILSLEDRDLPEQPYSRIVLDTLRRTIKEERLSFDNVIEIVHNSDWEWFAISNIYNKISNRGQLIVNDNQKEWIINWCLAKEKKIDFKTSIEKTGDNSYTIRYDAIYLWFFYREYRPEYSHSTLLDMLSFDYNKEGISYLEEVLTKREITKRIIENLNNGIEINDVLENHLEYCIKNNIKEALPFAFDNLFDENLENNIRRQCLSLILKSNKYAAKLKNALPKIKDKFKWEIIDEVINNKSASVYSHLKVLSKSNDSENSIKACEYLIGLQDIDSLKIYIRWVKEKNRFDSQMYETSTLKKLRVYDAVPLLMELMDIAYQNTFEQPDDFDRLDRLVLDALKAISLESQDNFFRIKESIETFIQEKKAIYKNVNWLYSFLDQLEHQFYVNKSQNITIKQAMNRLKILNFDDVKNLN